MYIFLYDDDGDAIMAGTEEYEIMIRLLGLYEEEEEEYTGCIETCDDE